MGIFSSWKWKLDVNKETLNSKLMVNNVYGREELGVQNKRYRLLHLILKYRIIIPLLKIINKYLKKVYKKPPINGAQFEHIRLFESIFEEATVNWMNTYINSLNEIRGLPKQDKEYWREQFYTGENGSYAMLRIMMQGASALFQTDDAYNEWLTFFLHETHTQVSEQLNKVNKDGKVHHLMHTVPKAMDPLYEFIYLRLKEDRRFEVMVVDNKQ